MLKAYTSHLVNRPSLDLVENLRLAKTPNRPYPIGVAEI